METMTTMNKISLIFAGIFCIVTVWAVAMDYTYPQGFNTTPQVKKVKNIRNGSIHVTGRRHTGFMHGK
jgi:hypothetical protein